MHIYILVSKNNTKSRIDVGGGLTEVKKYRKIFLYNWFQVRILECLNPLLQKKQSFICNT